MGSKEVNMIVGNKVWQVSKKMANATINMAKQKYEKQNVNAIVAVAKGNVVCLHKDVYETAEEMLAEVTKWINGQYSVYYVTKK